MSSFNLVLDTRPPAPPSLLLNAGAALTGSRDVQVTINTADYQGGAHDVGEMKLWGDVDPAVDALVQVLEADSDWQPFQEEYFVRLSVGSAPKTIYARLRDDVLNETIPFSDAITLDTTSPIVTVVVPITYGRISKVSPSDQASFGWQANQPFDEYEVRVVPNIGSLHTQGYEIPTTNGSVNTSGSGSFPANTPITTTIDGSDLELVSPGDGNKVIKVFVRVGSVWSV